jgi:hypothetical protein
MTLHLPIDQAKVWAAANTAATQAAKRGAPVSSAGLVEILDHQASPRRLRVCRT